TTPGCGSNFTQVRVWNFTDACGNTSANYTQTITASDNTVPVISTVANALDALTLECSDASGIAAARALAPSASDNCSSVTIHLVSDERRVGCESNFTQVRIWNFTDACGNTSANYTQTITASDNTVPVISTAANALD